jgi:CheY-like chemotaxis protein
MTKILLVEDDKSLREIYGVRLLAEGYDIVSAGDGEEALAMAIKERPQLIVSDVMMPKISGFDMLDILRSTSETKDIKVIMMTALSSEDQRARGEALGADRYLVKSQVGIEDVVRTVHDVLGDSLAPAPNMAQAFGAPAPSAVTRQAPIMPQRPAAPVMPPAPQPATQQAAPVYQAPANPTVSPLPQPAPQYQAPVAPPLYNPAPQPVVPEAVPVYQAPAAPTNPLPQPTAPFSTQRPASLGDRVIHPLTDQPPAVDVGDLINQELNGTTMPQAPIAPVPQPGVPPTTNDYQIPPAPQI